MITHIFTWWSRRRIAEIPDITFWNTHWRHKIFDFDSVWCRLGNITDFYTCTTLKKFLKFGLRWDPAKKLALIRVKLRNIFILHEINMFCEMSDLFESRAFYSWTLKCFCNTIFFVLGIVGIKSYEWY